MRFDHPKHIILVVNLFFAQTPNQLPFIDDDNDNITIPINRNWIPKILVSSVHYAEPDVSHLRNFLRHLGRISSSSHFGRPVKVHVAPPNTVRSTSQT